MEHVEEDLHKFGAKKWSLIVSACGFAFISAEPGWT
jgi:hypothetical protein